MIASAYIQLDGINVLDVNKVLEYCEREHLDTWWEGLANRFDLPRGFTAGRGAVLIKGAKVSELDTSVATHTLKFTCGSDTITLSQLTITHIEAVTGPPFNGDTAYLVHLADRRIYGPFSGGIGKSYNVLSPNDSNKFSTNSGKTWATLFDDLWDDTGFGTIDKTNVSWPSSSPEDITPLSASTWAALEKICEITNHYLILDHEGDFSLVSGGYADGVYTTKLSDNERNLIQGSNDTTPVKARMPEKVRVFFPAHNWQFQNGGDNLQNTFMDYWRNRAVSYKDINTADISGSAESFTGNVYVMYGSRAATYDDAGQWSNESDCGNDATALATKYVNRILNTARCHNIYKTVVDILPGSRNAVTAWYDLGEGIRTEIIQDQAFTYQQSAGGVRQSLLSSHVASSGFDRIPELSRPTMPYERFAIGRVNETITPEDSGEVYIQFVQGTTWSDTSLPHSVTAYEIFGKQYAVNDRVLLKWDQQGNRWLIVSYLSQEPVRFRLTADLALGSNADAKLLTWNPSTDSYDLGNTTVSVYDWFNTLPVAIRTGMFRGKIDYEGVAILRERADPQVNGDKDRYDIVWMENKADFVTFKLTAEITNQDEPTDATYEFSIGTNSHGFSRGRDPNPSANTIEVYDVTGAFLHAPVDSIGIAKYNDRNDHYEILICQLPSIMAEGTLNAELCADATGTFTPTKQYTQGPFCLPHVLGEQETGFPFNNPDKRRGQSGDTGIFVYDLLTKEWTIISVEKKTVSVKYDRRFDSSTGCWQYKAHDFAMEHCEDLANDTWQDEICGDQCS